MAQSQNTNSTLTLPDGTNKTSTGLSTNMIITVNGTPIGAIQSLQITEARGIKMIDEVGHDGHIDSTPVSSTNISGSCQRIRYDRLRIAEAFSRGYVHVHSQVYPFDIIILDKQKRDEGSQISTVIKNVWIKQIGYTLQASDWIITDNMEWEAETIFSVLNGGSSASVAVGGELGVKHFGGGKNGLGDIISGDGVVNIEQLADTGVFRGTMSTAGLIDIGDSSGIF